MRNRVALFVLAFVSGLEMACDPGVPQLGARGRPPAASATGSSSGVTVADPGVASGGSTLSPREATPGATQDLPNGPGDGPARARVDDRLDAGRAGGDGGASASGSPSSTSPDAKPVAESGEEGTPGFRPPRYGELAITEVLANPMGSDLGREWVEVWNRTPEALDLTTLHLSDSRTDVACPAGVLAPGGLVVVGQSTDAAKNGGAPVAAAYGTRLILNNDAERLALCAGPCGSGVVIDIVSWSGLGARYDGRALSFERSSDALAFCPAEVSFGAGNDYGTPGEINPACPLEGDGGSTPPAERDSAANSGERVDAGRDR